jgi:catechol 2,3-dioxygenase-like lactoylglutathione lyase family enzyme
MIGKSPQLPWTFSFLPFIAPRFSFSRPMLHHLSFAVTDLQRSGAFYDAVLAPMGYVRVWTHETAIGYGALHDGDKFAIKLRPGHVAVPGEGFHVAFAAPSHEAVGAFYRAALEHGGKDNGGPGIHSEYGDDYYAAFVFDRDGYRIEAVCKGKA